MVETLHLYILCNFSLSPPSKTPTSLVSLAVVVTVGNWEGRVKLVTLDGGDKKTLKALNDYF